MEPLRADALASTKVFSVAFISVGTLGLRELRSARRARLQLGPVSDGVSGRRLDSYLIGVTRRGTGVQPN